MAESPANRAAIQARFIAERGYWRPWTQALLDHNPQFLDSYAHYAGYPARVGPLPERTIELVYIALDASATHLYAAGLQTHLLRALEIGVRPQEVFDVLHLVAAQGLARVFESVSILAEETGMETASVPPSLEERAARLYAIPPPWLAAMAELDPGYVEAMLDFLEHGRPEDGLAPRDRCLIEVALHACFTGFNPELLRLQIRAAQAAGVTSAELLQVLQLGAHLAVHGTALGANTYAATQKTPG